MAGKEVERRTGNREVARAVGKPTNLVFEDARIVFRNFSGKEGQYNAEGERNFCLLLDPADAEQMSADGWNIKLLKPREEGDLPQPYIQVKVGYKIPLLAPKIKIITSRGGTDIHEGMVEMLDYVEVSKIDLIIRPREWAIRGETGIKAYLKTMFVIIQEDYLEQKYADVPDSALNTLEALPMVDGFDDEDIIDAEIVDEPEYTNTPF